MTDIREEILERLKEIAEELEGIKRVERDFIAISEDELPAVIILEGDEEADEGDPVGRPTTSPRRVTMTPEIRIMVRNNSADIGPQLSAFRAALIKAIAADAALKALVINGVGIRYRGLATALARGRTMDADMGLVFGLTYVLKPDEL